MSLSRTALGQPLRDRLQQLVAGVVAERVVDALEVVEVEEQARDLRAVALRLREDLLQPLVEQRPVRQPGQDVVLRELVGVRGRDLELASCAARPFPRACAGSSPTSACDSASRCVMWLNVCVSSPSSSDERAGT